MTYLIETPYELKMHLGHHLACIKRLDPWPHERQQTDKLRKSLLKDYKERCALCGMGSDIEAAHIVPLEIGAKTIRENLILLCKECHGKYDSGYVSIISMHTLAEKWRNREPIEFSFASMKDAKSLPSSAMVTPPQTVQAILNGNFQFTRKMWYTKAINILEKTLDDPALENDGRLYLMIKCAELHRRRAARRVLEKAFSILKAINIDGLPIQYHPLFYYELGYVHRLKGEHSIAADYFRSSADVSKANNKDDMPTIEYISASANEILCQLATHNSPSQKEAKDYVNRFHQLEIEAIKHGKYWGGRWALNCAAHKLQVYIKCRDHKNSWEALHRVRDLYYNADIFNGWDAGFKITISLLEGLMLTIFPKDDDDLNIGVGLLARAFVIRTGSRRRIEGIRDVGFGLVEGCRKIEDKLSQITIGTIEKIMNQIIDGTSVLWPWRAKS